MEADKAPLEALSSAPLTRSQRSIVEALVSAYPRYLTKDHLVDVMYMNDASGGSENADQTLRVHISMIRKLLPPLGWTIPKKVGKVGQNCRYRLEPIEGAQ